MVLTSGVASTTASVVASLVAFVVEAFAVAFVRSSVVAMVGSYHFPQGHRPSGYLLSSIDPY